MQFIIYLSHPISSFLKRIIKRILKIAGISIITLISVVLLYLGSAYCLSHICVNEDTVRGEDVEIYILSNGVHTDILVPVKNEYFNWAQSVKFENTSGNDSSADFVGFGWGDKGFYLETPTWADLKFSTAIKAAFALSKSAIHATFHHRLEEDENCKRIKINSSQYKKLIRFILSSFETTETVEIIFIETKSNYGSNDSFYEATGSYSLFHTCNTWANNALKACDQKACFWTPFKTGIFYHYNNN